MSEQTKDEQVTPEQLEQVRAHLVRLAKSVTRPLTDSGSWGFQIFRRDRENGDIEYQIVADTERGTQVAYVQSTRHDADFIAACLAQAPLFAQLLDRGSSDAD